MKLWVCLGVLGGVMACGGSATDKHTTAPAHSVAAPQCALDPVHDPLVTERFSTRNLRLNGAGSVLTMRQGGTVHALVDVYQHCTTCATDAIHEVVAGLHTDLSPQACLYTGAPVSTAAAGWQTMAFDLHVPNTPGVYYVRARYAQADTCAATAAWWHWGLDDSAASNMGVVVVTGLSGPSSEAAPKRCSATVQDTVAAVGHFQVRNVHLNQQSNAIATPHGGPVAVEMEINPSCAQCGTATLTQIVAGIPGEPHAQACVWSGAPSDGWQTVRFGLTIPGAAGTHAVRLRHVHAQDCQGALNAWDAGDSQNLAANVGAVTVQPADR